MENNVYFLDHSLLSAQAAMNLRWREEVQKLSQDHQWNWGEEGLVLGGGGSG